MPDTVQQGIDNLLAHANENIRRGTVARDAKGRPATVRSGSVNHPMLNDGRPTLIPFQWNGRIIEDPDEAAEMALKSGLVWPSFDTHDEATAVSRQISNSLRIQ